jgi:CRP/FNR family transcriptional regulator
VSERTKESASNLRTTDALKRAASCFACQARERSEWSTLAPEEVRQLNEVKVRNTYRTGQMVFYQGNPCLGIYCIVEGTVVLRKTDAAGNSVIVRLAKAGQTIGYRAFFAGSPYEASAEAVIDSTICFIDKAAMRRLLEQNPSIGHNFLRRLAQELEESEQARLEANTLSVRARLAHLLLVLKDSYGRVDDDGNIIIELPLARQDVAAMIGARPESTSRAIKALQSDHVARFEGRDAIVDDLDRLLDEIDPEH